MRSGNDPDSQHEVDPLSDPECYRPVPLYVHFKFQRDGEGLSFFKNSSGRNSNIWIRGQRTGTGGCISVAPPTIPFATELFCFVLQVAGPGGLPARGVWIVTGTQACRCNRYSYSTPSRCSPAAFQPADLSHLTLGGNSPFALSVSPRPLAAKLLNLEARNYLNLRWEICKRT